jgi:hypothetical protein
MISSSLKAVQAGIDVIRTRRDLATLWTCHYYFLQCNNCLLWVSRAGLPRSGLLGNKTPVLQSHGMRRTAPLYDATISSVNQFGYQAPGVMLMEGSMDEVMLEKYYADLGRIGRVV